MRRDTAHNKRLCRQVIAPRRLPAFAPLRLPGAGEFGIVLLPLILGNPVITTVCNLDSGISLSGINNIMQPRSVEPLRYCDLTGMPRQQLIGILTLLLFFAMITTGAGCKFADEIKAAKNVAEQFLSQVQNQRYSATRGLFSPRAKALKGGVGPDAFLKYFEKLKQSRGPIKQWTFLAFKHELGSDPHIRFSYHVECADKSVITVYFRMVQQKGTWVIDGWATNDFKR